MTNDLPKLPPPYYFYSLLQSPQECIYVLREDCPKEKDQTTGWPHAVVAWWDGTDILLYGRKKVFENFAGKLRTEGREEALRLIELLANLGEL